MPLDLQILGSGVYTPREAARLVGVEGRDVLRWTRGTAQSAPLWNAYFLPLEGSTEISFLDVVELRVVAALRRAGVSLQAIRFAIDFAERAFNIERPLSSQRFCTDGQEILMDALEEDGELTSLSRKRAGQKVFKKIVEQSLLDLEYQDDRPVRWWPKRSKHIVIDPNRFFGDPILNEYSVSTRTLREDFDVLKNVKYLSKIYEIPEIQARSAINFERKLDGKRII